MCQFFSEYDLKIASKQKLEQELSATGQNTFSYLDGILYNFSFKLDSFEFQIRLTSGGRLTQKVFVTQNFDAGILTF